MKPILSIVTITKNNMRGLEKTLSSLRDQDLPRTEFEVVVIDAVSTDGTTELVQSFDDLDLTVVCEPDRGVYDAMNKGCGLSRGSYLQFLNAGDALLRGDALSTIADAIRGADNPTWAVFGAMHLHGGARTPAPINNLPHRVRDHALGRHPHCHQACWFSAGLTDALGGYSEDFDFVGDFDFILRAGLIDHPLEIAELLVAYEGGGLSHQRRAEIPRLLHRVRVERLGLSGRERAWDSLYTLAQTARLRTHGVKASLTRGT